MASRSAHSIAKNSAARVAAGKARRATNTPLRIRVAPIAPQPRIPIVPTRISTDFTSAFVKSPAEAERLTSTLLTSDRPVKERLADSGELLHSVSASGNVQQRRTLIAGFRKAGAELALVHHMALLPREQTAGFMEDYLAAGGSLAPVVEWLGVVGSVRRAARGRSMRTDRMPARWASSRRRGAPSTARGFGDWLSDVWEDVKKAGAAVVNAVDSLVDSVLKAGKSLADAIGEAVNWTIDKVTDLVDALLDAGKRVADILAAAAAKGIEQLKKYVEAVLAAGRAIGEVLLWAASQVAATVNAVVAKLLQLGRTVLEILKTMVNAGRTAILAIAKALLAAGKTLANIIAAVANEAASVLKPIIDGLLAAGQTLRNVLVEAAKVAANACRNIVSALIDLGKSLGALLMEAAAAVGNTLRSIVEALLALGQSLTRILVAAAALTAATVKSIVQTLLALGKSLAELVLAVVGQAVTVVKTVFTALVAAGRKVVEILVALARRAVSALRTALEALLAMGVSLASLVKDIVTGVAEAFRRGFFEALVALGKAPLQLLKAAAEVSVAVLLLALAVVLEMCGGYRPLTKEELAEARKVFGKAIDLDRVKLGFAALPGDVIRYLNIEMPRAFTTMYLLNFGPGAKVEMQTIIHELAHVWQGVQEGPLYMTRALEAQIGAGVESLFHTGKYNDSAAYTVTADALTANRGELKKFNPEQQASIVEFFWVRAFSNVVVPGGFRGDDRRATGLTLDALLPYVQNVSPALRAPARALMAKRKIAPRASTKSASDLVYI
jgi:hypothetical protein